MKTKSQSPNINMTIDDYISIVRQSIDTYQGKFLQRNSILLEIAKKYGDKYRLALLDLEECKETSDSECEALFVSLYVQSGTRVEKYSTCINFTIENGVRKMTKMEKSAATSA